MKETSTARKEIAGWQIAGVEKAGVGALHEGDARIVPQGLGDLAVAGVDGEDARGAVLEHAIGESAGGGADVEAEAVGGDRCANGRERLRA